MVITFYRSTYRCLSPIPILGLGIFLPLSSFQTRVCDPAKCPFNLTRGCSTNAITVSTVWMPFINNTLWNIDYTFDSWDKIHGPSSGQAEVVGGREPQMRLALGHFHYGRVAGQLVAEFAAQHVDDLEWRRERLNWSDDCCFGSKLGVDLTEQFLTFVWSTLLSVTVLVFLSSL